VDLIAVVSRRFVFALVTGHTELWQSMEKMDLGLCVPADVLFFLPFNFPRKIVVYALTGIFTYFSAWEV
jgi:hypothetical protein